MIPDDDLARWQALADAATPGPWHDQEDPKHPGNRWVTDYRGLAGLIGTGQGEDAEADAAFIAASRRAVPALLAEVQALREDCATLADARLGAEVERDALRDTVKRVRALRRPIAPAGSVQWRNGYEIGYDQAILDARAALADTPGKAHRPLPRNVQPQFEDDTPGEDWADDANMATGQTLSRFYSLPDADTPGEAHDATS